MIPVSLRDMARSIARSAGGKGAVVIVFDHDGVRIGVDGLSGIETQDALCTAIHYNFLHGE